MRNEWQKKRWKRQLKGSRIMRRKRRSARRIVKEGQWRMKRKTKRQIRRREPGSSKDAAMFEGGTWSSEERERDHVTYPTPLCS